MSKKKILAMIPARMGSQRLKQKNLRELSGVPLITRAIRKCKDAKVFDEVWVNSENTDFADIAVAEGVQFHHRPLELGNNHATSEQYIAEFLTKHECDFLVQVHSIAPLLTVEDIREFVDELKKGEVDCLLSIDMIQIECAYKGRPINFSFSEKTNSQDIEPIQRISWSITGWRRAAYLEAVSSAKCATYSGKIGFHPINPMAAHVIKTERDLEIAEALFPLIQNRL
jgi:CMP-N-acetylneuraminic acid synthetase